MDLSDLFGVVVATSILAFAPAQRGLANSEPPKALTEVLVVGNSVSGTVSFIDARSLARLGDVDVIPDIHERLREIHASPLRSAIYSILKAQQKIKFEPKGADGDRFVDDVFLSPDGATLYVSRSNLGDVAAFDMTKSGFPMLWRNRVALFKTDHAALSPDGTQLAVSDGPESRVKILETGTGQVVGSFKTGNFSHQNDYSKDGRYIFNTSIGSVSLPYALRAFKGPHRLTVADARTFKIVRTYRLKSGIRPNVITDDGSTMYAQLSYLNGVIKFDLATGKETARSTQPWSESAKRDYRKMDELPHNSAHHGLALSGDGKWLCDAGTVDNTVSILSTQDLSVRGTLDVGKIPYWATTSDDGKRCFVSLSGDDEVAVVGYESRAVEDKIRVGRFPQRSRIGKITPVTYDLLRTGWSD